MSFNNLPKFVFIHLCSYFDLKSHATFSLVNRSYYNRFLHLRELYKILLQKSIEKPSLKLDECISKIINQSQTESNPILHLACQNEKISTEMVKYLIENKSDLNLKVKYDFTPIHYVCKNKNISIELIKCSLKTKQICIRITFTNLMH